MSRRYAPEEPDYDPRWASIIAAAGAPSPLDYRPPADLGLCVLHLDDAVLALDKPALLLSVPGKGAGMEDCLEARAKAAFPEARTVHRLDRPTSGVVVMARDAAAHRALGWRFERRQIEKTYVARVAGVVRGAEGEIDAPLCGDWPRRPLQMVHFEHGKPARTVWRRLAVEDGATRLELTPVTGRTHQLRVHLAWIGHPILGDEFYAPEKIRRAAPRLQLHAAALRMTHPRGDAPLHLAAPCPF
ncbi:MAG: RluA family pseudouridine synthase [Pseudomonadota bacterium]